MAISVVQAVGISTGAATSGTQAVAVSGGPVANGSSFTKSITGVTAGNTLIVVCSAYPAQPTITTNNPAANTSIARDFLGGGDTGHHWDIAVYRLSNVSGGSHTISFKNGSSLDSGYYAATIYEVSGLDSSAPLDKTGSASSTNNTITATATAANASADDLVLFGVAIGGLNPGENNTTFTDPTGYTRDFRQGDALNSMGALHCHKIVSATETSTASTTKANNTQLAGSLIATYKQATGSPARTGTLAVTLDNATISAAGAATVKGNESTQLAATTISAGGTVAVQGSAAVTLADTTISASGNLGNAQINGDAAVNLAATGITAGGTVTVQGTASVTLANTSASAAGSVTVQGGASVALAGTTIAASGTVATSAVAPQITDIKHMRLPWQTAAWQPAASVSVTLAAGDSIVVCIHQFPKFGDPSAKFPPTITGQTIVEGIDPGTPAVVTTEVYQFVNTAIYYKHGLAAGTYTVNAPSGIDVASANNDSNVWVCVVSGLKNQAPTLTKHTGPTRSLHSSGDTSLGAPGSFQNGDSTHGYTATLPSAANVGDAIFAVWGSDNDTINNGGYGIQRMMDNLGWVSAGGWTEVGKDDDAHFGLPGQVLFKVATVADNQAVTFHWDDTRVVSNDAVMAAFAPAVASTINGSASVQLANTSISSAGAALVQGSAAVNLAATAVASAGAVLTQGSAALALAPTSFAAAGKVSIGGSLAVTLADSSLTATGVHGAPSTGDLAVTLADVQIVATGSASITGGLNAALGATIASGNGSVAIKGNMSATLAPVGFSADGTVPRLPINGSMTVTLAGVGIVATGSVYFVGQATQRIYGIAAQNRALALGAELRTLTADAQDRSIPI